MVLAWPQGGRTPAAGDERKAASVSRDSRAAKAGRGSRAAAGDAPLGQGLPPSAHVPPEAEVSPGAALLARGRGPWVLLGLLALTVTGLLAPQTVAPATPAGGIADVELYRRIASRVAAGAGYYPTALQLQLENGYPTQPAMAVRLPTLTLIESGLGSSGAGLLLGALAVAALVALLRRLELAGVTRGERVLALVLAGLNLSLVAVGGVVWFHDAWAGVLILLAFALWREHRWWPSVVLGLAAVSVRELALPFLVVMLVLSWRRRREALAWAGAILVFAAGYLGHVLAVLATPVAGARASNGWFTLGGWPAVVATAKLGSVLAVTPGAVAAVLVPLAFVGWLFAPRGLRAGALTCAVFAAIFAVIGRPDNAYWGLLDATLLLCGLAFAPRGLAATIRSIRGRRADEQGPGSRTGEAPASGNGAG